MGMWEILLIFLVVLLLFGAKRLPEIGSSLGKGIREFKGSLREIENELKVDDSRPQNRQVQRPPAGDEVESTPRRLTSDSGPQRQAATPEPKEESQPSPTSGGRDGEG